MSIDEKTTGVELPAVTLIAGPLRVKRSIRVRQSGLLVTLKIRPRESITAERVVVDPLPKELEIDAIGFHPAHEPARGSIDRQRVIVSGIEAKTEAIEIRYGLCPSRPQRPESVSSLQDSATIVVEDLDQDDVQGPPDAARLVENHDRRTWLSGRGVMRTARQLGAQLDIVSEYYP